MSQADFKDLINKTIFSVAVDDSRPILKGCLLEISENGINSVALDGYRLAYCKKEIKHSTVKTNVIVPARSLGEISRILEDSTEIINIYIQKNAVMVDLKDTKIISKLLEGEFLNYKQIIPNHFETSVVINKAQFEDALDHRSGCLVHDPLCSILRVFAVAKGDIGCQRDAMLALGLLYRTDFAAGILGKKLIEPVFDSRNIIIGAVGVNGVKVVVDGNIAHTIFRKSEVDIQARQGRISPQPGQVFRQHNSHFSCLDF